MMTDQPSVATLPLHYFKAHVLDILIDDTFYLPPKLVVRPLFSASLRKRGYTPDVLISLIREDPTLLQAITPVVTLTFKTPRNIRLHHLALHPVLTHLIGVYQLLREEAVAHQITHYLSTVGRVIHLNHDNLDCRSENLREMKRIFE